MTRIGDLLDRDFSRPIQEIVKLDNHDPETVFRELTEYIATEGIKAAYEGLFSALAAFPKSPNESVGVWISGCFGSGKSYFAKNLGYVLANREVRGTPASSLVLHQVESTRVAECVAFLNREMPYEVFMFGVEMFGVQVEPPLEGDADKIVEGMYRALLRDLDYAEDCDISELEIELEKAGKLAAFQDLCRVECNEEWRKIRSGEGNIERASALLHRLDPRTYAAEDAWLSTVKARPCKGPTVEDLVAKSFDLCEIRRPGRPFAFIMDEMGQYAALSGERIECLRAIVEQFGKESLKRMRAGRIPGPAWIVVTAERNLQEVFAHLIACRIDTSKILDCFRIRIDLSRASIREVLTHGVLHKKESQESVLRQLFRDCGASLIQNVKLERSTRRTEFDEDLFVRFYPYLPFTINLFLDIVEGILVHPNAPKHVGAGNRTVARQAFEMLVSDRTRFLDRPAGALVSIDKIYDLLEGDIPPEKRQDVIDIRQRLDGDEDYPKMAGRVAKAICLLELARKDLPCTTKNIAALLIQRVTEAPPILAVAAALFHMREAQFARETEYGWLLYDLDKPRRFAADLEWQRRLVGTVNARPPGWRSDVIQYVKKWFARSLNWYTRPLHVFNTSVTRSLEGVVWSLEHLSQNRVTVEQLSRNVAAFEQLSMDVVAIEARLAQSEKRNAALAEALAGLQKTANPEAAAGRENSRFGIGTAPRDQRTTYIIGLFGTGRRYINELLLRNIGERAKYFRDTIRLHPGPTPMIYSGHATMRHVSRDQEPPAVMSRILEALREGFANSIFVYRHPLDSLLTNWVWWRTYIRDNRWISGISQVYKTTDDFCADLDRNFLEFKTFAEGDPAFFAAAPGPPFLSFAEFAEETGLHLQSATLALRLEDFMIDPRKEFSKIAAVMSVDLDGRGLSVDPPKSKPYGYWAVQEKVPRFRSFIDGLDGETKRRLERIGYDVTV
ncbi:MAG: hypothetical protein ABSG65_14580 [Bryobacteraceae bacterium]|jgi:hypothetical protein